MLAIGKKHTEVLAVDEKTILDIAKISGDTNPIHMDERYAENTKFGKRIAHALFCLNGISMILGNYLPGNGTILISQNFQYLKPVYIGDEIEITVTVIERLSKNKYMLRTLCKNQLGDIVLDGESIVKWGEV